MKQHNIAAKCVPKTKWFTTKQTFCSRCDPRIWCQGSFEKISSSGLFLLFKKNWLIYDAYTQIVCM